MSRIAPPIPNRLDLPLAAGKVLRIDFERNQDRWLHRVFLILPEPATPSTLLLLESVEGTSEEDWPVSPPLQFVSIETRPKKPPVALLMGMAGGSHWSASIEQEFVEQTLRFDVACRAKGQPQELGSRYRIASRVSVVQASDNLIEFTAGGLTFLLTGEAAKDAPRPALQQIDQDLRVHFGETASEEPRTYRWIYRLQVKA